MFDWVSGVEWNEWSGVHRGEMFVVEAGWMMFIIACSA